MATTPADRVPPLSADERAAWSRITADCQAAGQNLRMPPLQRAARAALAPAPSLRYDDFPREVGKREIRVSDATARLAAALHLHLH